MTERERQRLYRRIGERVQEQREDAPLSQEKLGDLVGLSRSSIVNIEKGRQRPPLHRVWEIAETLEVNPSDLIPSLEEVKSPEDVDPELEERIIEEIGSDDPEAIRQVADFIQTS